VKASLNELTASTVAWHRLTRTKVDKYRKEYLVARTEMEALTTNSQQEDRADQFPVRLGGLFSIFSFCCI